MSKPEQQNDEEHRYIANVDSCNEEIERQCTRLGLPRPEFEADNDRANEIVAELRKRTPGSAKVEEQAPEELKVGDTKLTGLSRAIAANDAPKRKPSPAKAPDSPFISGGLARATAANAKLNEKAKK